jgi:hypothetical protein
MSSQRWGEIERLYESAVDLDAGARVALLEKAEPEIRREVEALLARGGSGGSFLERPAWTDPDPKPGARKEILSQFDSGHWSHIMTPAIRTGQGGAEPDAPGELFSTPLFFDNTTNHWDIAPDGKRFLLAQTPAPPPEVPLTVVANWLAGLKK